MGLTSAVKTLVNTGTVLENFTMLIDKRRTWTRDIYVWKRDGRIFDGKIFTICGLHDCLLGKTRKSVAIIPETVREFSKKAG